MRNENIIIHSRNKDVGTLRFTIVATPNKNSGEAYTVGVALCSERDRFDRKIGRRIALGRAKSNAFTATVVDKDELFERQDEIVELAVNQLLNRRK